MSRHHRIAWELLGGPAKLISLKSTWTFGSPSVLYLFWREKGMLNQELEQMDECMPYYYRLTGGHGTGAEHIMRGEIHLYRGEIDEAEIYCHRAIFAADSVKQSSIAQCGLFTLARIAIIRGDTQVLEHSLGWLKKHAETNTEDLCRYTYDMAKAYLALLAGTGEELPTWLSEGHIDEKRLVIMTQPFAHIIYGRVLLERKEYQKLLGIAPYVIGISSIFPNLLPQVYYRIYMAQALLALGKEQDAVVILREGVELALQVAVDSGSKHVGTGQLHVDNLQRLITHGILVDAHLNILGVTRRIQAERCGLGGIRRLLKRYFLHCFLTTCKEEREETQHND